MTGRRWARDARWALGAVGGMLWLMAALGGPAGAANTASELLVDRSDRVTVTQQDGIRPFAGRDRYETSALLAERYAQQRGGIGAVSAVVVVSGESAADGFAAAGLAGRWQAPVLLTPPGVLAGEVAEFIDRHDVSTVIAVGGPEALAPDVLAEMAALEAGPSVQRVGGGDRYRTAAAAASQLGSGGGWCGADGSAVLVVNGRDDHVAAAVGLGPVAFARELPILLTHRDELPAAAAEYLRGRRIDRAVIVGDASAVSDAVVSPLLAAGVDEVIRVADVPSGLHGAAAAQLMAQTCRHELGPSASVVAVAGCRGEIDAVAAAPLLGIGVDGSGPVPLLSSCDPLPAAVRGFLASTLLEVDRRKNHLQVVAIGGLAAVDEATMRASVRAAASAPALTAQIRAEAGDSTLRITYSERLEADADRFIGRVRDLLYVNDAPAWISGQPTVSDSTAETCREFSSLDVPLFRGLEPGDRIELLAADGWHSSNGDRRQIRGAALTVPEPAPPLGSPRIELIAPPGEDRLWVSVTANEFRDPDTGPDGGITVNPGRVRVIAEDRTAVAVRAADTAPMVHRLLGAALWSFPLRADGAPYALAPGDRVVARSGLAVNANQQRSRSRGTTVAAPAARLAVTSVRVGPPNPGVDDGVHTPRPAEIASVSQRAHVALGNSLRIVAKWSGSAAGAAGNGWEIHSTRSQRPLGPPQQDPPATQVWVDTRHRSIRIHHVDTPGEPRGQTYGELVRFLNDSAAFGRHFAAELSEPCEGGDAVVDLDETGLIGDAELIGGISSVSFLVTFSDNVSGFAPGGDAVVGADAAGGLVDDILGGLIADYGEAVAGIAADRVEVAAPVPGAEVVFRFTTEDPDHTIGQQISVRSNRIDIREGVAASWHPDDPDTADVDESVNAARAIFAVPSRESRLATDLPNGANRG